MSKRYKVRPLLMISQYDKDMCRLFISGTLVNFPKSHGRR